MLSKNQKVYKFSGNSIPFVLFFMKSSNGFISENRYFKEVLDEKGSVQFKDRKKKLIQEEMIYFKHKINRGYYLIIAILIYASYGLNSFIEIVAGSAMIGAILWLAKKKFENSIFFILSLMLLMITIYGYVYNNFEVAYLIFISMIVYQALLNYTSIKVAYRISGPKKGYYIWTDAKCIGTVGERIEVKSTGDEDYVSFDNAELTEKEKSSTL